MIGLTFLIATAILEVGLFVIGPALQSSVSANAADAFYVVLRLVTIVSFSFLCIRRYKRDSSGALSLTGLLIFIDQVIFKSLWIWLSMKKDPAVWQGVDAKT